MSEPPKKGYVEFRGAFVDVFHQNPAEDRVPYILEREIKSLLPDNYSKSKDWTHSDIFGRIVWLTSMLESKMEEVDFWVEQLNRANADHLAQLAEAKTSLVALVGISATRDTSTGEPIMWGDETGDCLTPEVALQERVKLLIREAEARGMERAAKACDRRAGNASDFDRYTRRAAGMCAADIRAEAAAIRAGKGEA